MQDTSRPGPKSARRWWWLLLIVPVVGPLWVPYFDRVEPQWMGIPFFYWYQFLWVPISAVISAFVYFMTRDLV